GMALVMAMAAVVAATVPASPAAAATRSYIDSSYYTLFDCQNTGSGGVTLGRWIDYDCEDNFVTYMYDLYVLVNVEPVKTCKSDAQAYIVRSGVVYSSGFEGDERFGIPTLNISRGQHVTVGGNGIKPGQQVFFYFYNDAGTQVWGTNSHAAGSNCV